MSDIDQLFDVHMLNDRGKTRAEQIAITFTTALHDLSSLVGENGAATREFAVVRTKLQEAAFFAKRAMAMQDENQNLEIKR